MIAQEKKILELVAYSIHLLDSPKTYSICLGNSYSGVIKKNVIAKVKNVKIEKNSKNTK